MEEKLSKANSFVQVLYYLTEALDLITIQADREFRKSGVEIKQEIKRTFNEMSKSLNRYFYWSEKLDEEVGNTSDPLLVHDARQEGGNELARLLLLYYDRCGGNEVNAFEIFGMLRKMKSSGIFNDKDINHFIMK